MESVKYELELPKEGKEVVDLLDSILEKVLNKAPMAEYAALFGQASVAVDGISSVGEEMKSHLRDELAGYMVHKLMGRLLPIKAVQEEPKAAE